MNQPPPPGGGWGPPGGGPPGPPGGYGPPPGGPPGNPPGGYGGPPPGGYGGPPQGGYGGPPQGGYGGPPGPGGPYGYGGGPPPKKSNSGAIIAAVILGIVVLCGVFGAIGSRAANRYIDKSKEAAGDDETYTAPDKSGRIDLPSTWRAMSDLNDEASIQAGNAFMEEYLIVISEKRADFGDDIDLEKYADICLDGMAANIGKLDKGKAREKKIGGRDALLLEVRAKVDGLDVVYLVAYVEGPESYHQVLSWTLEGKYDRNKERLERAVRSFREL